MTPVVFDGCFGWLHPAAGRRGVVLCAPYGNEALTTHRAWRAFAERLADAGLPTLRFDYPGTGDSAGGEEDPDRLRAWIDGIHAAMRFLRASTGVEEVALVGLRLGALLAAVAANEVKGVSALVLLAPCLSGRSFVQELRAMSLLAVQPEGAPPVVTAEGIDNGGFRLAPDTMAELRGLDMLALTEPPAPRVLLFDRPDARGLGRLRDHLRRLGADLSEEPFPDFAQLMSNVQRATAPCETFERAVAWLKDSAPAGDTAPATASQATPPDASLVLPGATERPALFGPAGDLFGVLCEPAGVADGRDRPAVLLLNSGATYHVGSGRMSVRLARRLASRGYASLRMDLAGLGDSGSRPGCADNLIYCRESVLDVRAALDWLEARGHRRCVLVGLCAGAATALHSALADGRIVGQALINPGRFALADGVTSEAVIGAAVKPIAAYLPRLADRATWRAILRKDRKAARVAQGLSKRIVQRLRIKAGRVRAWMTGRGYASDDVAHWFHQLSERGVHTLMVHGADDVTLGEFETHFGSDGGPLRGMPNLRMERIAGADHSLTVRPARERFIGLLDEHLDAIDVATAQTVARNGTAIIPKQAFASGTER